MAEKRLLRLSGVILCLLLIPAAASAQSWSCTTSAAPSVSNNTKPATITLGGGDSGNLIWLTVGEEYKTSTFSISSDTAGRTWYGPIPVGSQSAEFYAYGNGSSGTVTINYSATVDYWGIVAADCSSGITMSNQAGGTGGWSNASSSPTATLTANSSGMLGIMAINQGGTASTTPTTGCAATSNVNNLVTLLVCTNAGAGFGPGSISMTWQNSGSTSRPYFYGLFTPSGGTPPYITTLCPPGTQMSSYSCSLSIQNGASPYTFTTTTAGYAPLPEGTAIDTSGNINASLLGGQGDYNTWIQATDANGNRMVDTLQTFAIASANGFLQNIFPPTSIFRHRMDAATTGLPVDTSPAAPIPSAYLGSSVKAGFGTSYANVPNGIPAVEVPCAQPDVKVRTTEYQSYFTSAPIPPYAPPEGTSASTRDRHVIVYEEPGCGQNGGLFEMWEGIHNAGSNSWIDGSNALWRDVTTNNLTPQGKGTSDAAGLPVGPLLITMAEVEGTCTPSAPCGTIRHIIRATINEQLDNWVWPATTSAGIGSCTGFPAHTQISQSSPPSACSWSGPNGEIYRLKASVSTPACATTSPQAAIIITALRNYGVILADNGGTGYLIGSPDSGWDETDLACLRRLTMSDFEPVNVSSLMKSTGSGQTRNGSAQVQDHPNGN